MWTANRFVTNPPLDCMAYDYVNYVRDTDTLVVASAETLRRHRKFMNQMTNDLADFVGQFLPSDLMVDPKSEAFRRGVELRFLKPLEEAGNEFLTKGTTIRHGLGERNGSPPRPATTTTNREYRSRPVDRTVAAAVL